MSHESLSALPDIPGLDNGWDEHDEERDVNASKDVRAQSDEAFLADCRPELERLEDVRIVKQTVYKRRKTLALPAVVVGTPLFGFLDYLLLMVQSGNDDSGAGLTLLFWGALYWWVTQPKRQYAKAYKEKILPRIVKLFGHFTYSPDQHISAGKMKPSKILPSYDRIRGEDYFRGRYKDVEIEFGEMKLTERRGSGKNRRTVTTFCGLAILLEMKRKKFNGHTILDRDKGGIGEWIMERASGLERANLVDPRFEEKYDAYTNDQVEARYLLDPAIIEEFTNLFDEFDQTEARDHRPRDKSWIEKIGKFVKRYRGEHTKSNLKAAYYDNKLLLLISTKHNHFEPADLHIPATDPVSILHMKREIGDVLNLVDRLDLYDPATA